MGPDLLTVLLITATIVLSVFTIDAQYRISAEKAWTQLFLPLTLLNMPL